MPRFNLDDYETVESRINRFYADNPDGRIVCYELTSKADRAKGYWVVRAQIFMDHEDQHAMTPKATGLAFEIEGTAGANATAALENAETSAIGRALANAGYSGNKRTSREEMAKVNRAANPVPDDVFVKIDAAVSLEELEAIWKDSVEKGWSDQILKHVKSRKAVLQNESKG
jgi:hypothetical protein